MNLDPLVEEVVRRVVDALRPVIREEVGGSHGERPGQPPPLAVTVEEAGRRLGGRHPTTIRRWIKSGALPATRSGGREYLIRISDLEAFVATQAREAVREPTVDERIAKIAGSIPRRK